MGIKERNGAREGHARVDRAGSDPDSWASLGEDGSKELRAGGLQGAPHSLCLHPQSGSVRQGLDEALVLDCQAPSLASSLSVGKLLHISVPLFPHLNKRELNKAQPQKSS